MHDYALPTDTRTCREIQDAAIATLWEIVIEAAGHIDKLEARVDALEREATRTTPAITWTGTPPEARTATVGQTYSWRPGDWISEYCAAEDGPQVTVTVYGPARDDALDDDLDDAPDPMEDV